MFIIVGTIIAIYCVSIGISFFDIDFNMKNDPNTFWKNNFVAQFTFNSNKNYSTILSNLDYKDKNNSFLSSRYEIDTKQKNRVNYLMGVYGYNTLNNVFPLYSGRFFNEREVNSKEKIAMIGYNIRDEIYMKNGQKYIDVDGDAYNVMGIIGRYTSSYWNTQILIPFKALPKDLLSQGSHSLQLMYPNDMLYDNNYFDKLKANLKNQGLVSINKSETFITSASKKTFEDEESRYISIIFTILLAVISLVTFSTFWSTDLKRNFAIKRILGASNLNILKMLFFEIIFITIISTIISFGLHIFTLNILNGMVGEKVYFNALNVWWGTIFALIVTVLNTLWIYRNILKFNVLEDIK
jgi:putative ABC transport system permease protein